MLAQQVQQNILHPKVQKQSVSFTGTHHLNRPLNIGEEYPPSTMPMVHHQSKTSTVSRTVSGKQSRLDVELQSSGINYN